jgi:hypothetical protein
MPKFEDIVSRVKFKANKKASIDAGFVFQCVVLLA